MPFKHVAPALSLVALAAMTTPTFGVTLLEDDFESYADTAAMNAVWNFNSGNISTLNTTLPGPTEGTTTKSLNNTPTANTQQAARSITPTAASNETPILWQFDYFWDGTGNKRMTGGLRVNTGEGSNSGILEMGFYNAARNPFTSTDSNNVNGSGFAVRTILVPGYGTLPEAKNYGAENGGTANGWIMMPNIDNTANFSLSGLANTWFTFAATITGDSITYTIDTARDGTIDSTYVAHTDTLDLTQTLFDSVRFGTGLTSGGGGADFDNLIIKTVPSAPPHFAGDTNNDGVVDLVDLNNVLNNFGSTDLGNAGDDNTDGVVDLVDLNNVLNNFGATQPASALSVVPEPASLGLIGLLGLGLARRRRA